MAAALPCLPARSPLTTRPAGVALQPEVCQPENVKVPVQMHFGELDDFKGFSDPEASRIWLSRVWLSSF